MFCEGMKTLKEKEKMLVTSIFSHSHNDFKRLLSKGRQQSALCGIDLIRSLIHHFKTVQNLKKLQKTTEMWLLKDYLKIQIP